MIFRIKIILGIKMLEKELNGIESRIDDLYNILIPSNNKTMLDVCIKLYEDEVARYRFLEEKAVKVFNFVGILIPIYLSLAILLFKSDNIDFSCISKLLCFLTAISLVTIISVLLFSFKLTLKPTIKITDKTLELVENENYDNFYIHFYKAYDARIESYRVVNKHKAIKINCAYYVIFAMYIFFILSLLSIGYDYLF